MYQFISDLLWNIVKPIASNVVRKNGYPEDAINRKCGNIPEDGFKKDDNAIMFHGVSVGEAVALENLVKRARTEFPESKIVMTTGTFTGQEIAKKKLAEYTDLITYFPADFPCVIKKFLDKTNPSVVFIAECKFWKGEKVFMKTIDQLLSYLTWRDSKAAIIFFVTQKGFSDVISKVKKTIVNHCNYLGYIDSPDESWLNYRFHINGDRNREVRLAIQLFHIPTL